MDSPSQRSAFLRLASSLFVPVALLAAGCGSAVAPVPSPDAGGDDDAGAVVDDGGLPPIAIDASTPLPEGIYEIYGLDFDGDPSDLAPLDAIVEGADVVSFGETIHFSYGYARARARLIRYAVEHLGLRAVAFEGHWSAARAVDRYVHGEGTQREALAGLTFGAWTNAPTAALLDWIRAFNAEHPDDRVVVFAFDIQDPTADGAVVREVLAALEAAEAIDAATAELLRDRLRACPGAWQATIAAAYSDPVDGPILRLEMPMPMERFVECNDSVIAIGEAIGGATSALDAQQTVFARVALRAIAAFEAETYYLLGDPVRGYESRDTAMAETFFDLWPLLAPGARVAIFAHNAHIARRSTEDRGEFVFESFGTHVGERLGDRYAPIGLFAHEVAWQWPNEIGRGRVVISSPTAMETILGALDRDHLLVDLEAATGEGRLFAPGREYEMGHGPAAIAAPLTQYRGLFFLRVSEETPLDGGFGSPPTEVEGSGS
jgi:erythromycin esterase-like protein